MRQMDCDELWVCQMAARLTREIMGTLAGIQLSVCDRPLVSTVEMNAVCGFVDGQYRLRLRFLAEPQLFLRFTRCMAGADADAVDQELVAEYAAEFFNILCGRFISELHRVTNSPARFYPTYFEEIPDDSFFAQGEPVRTLYFESDVQELAEFSWGHG